VIRQKCCEAIGLISEDSPYYNFRQDLQYTAQHKTSLQVVEKHYALSNKPSREGKLLEYLRVEFHEPAIQLLHDALCTKDPRLSSSLLALLRLRLRCRPCAHLARISFLNKMFAHFSEKIIFGAPRNAKKFIFRACQVQKS
jgi:hypothetical protein